MDAKVERFADNEMATKVATIIESGAGGDVCVLPDFDAYLYGEKLADVTDVAKEVGDSGAAGTTSPSRRASSNGKWRALMFGQAPAAWNYRTDMFKAAGVDKFPDTFDELLGGRPRSCTTRARRSA